MAWGYCEMGVRIEEGNVGEDGFYRLDIRGAGNEAAMRQQIATVTRVIPAVYSKQSYCFPLRKLFSNVWALCFESFAYQLALYFPFFRSVQSVKQH